MLFTILVMAVAVSLEPFRIGMTALMLNRPRPTLHLLAFLSGGFAMGLTVGLTVLFVFRRIVVGTPYFTLPKVQILIGALALLAATLLAAKALADRVGRGPGRIRSAIDRGRLVPWAQRLLDGRSVWLAGVAGLGIALPSVDYLAALAVILASGAAVMTQVGALLIFNVVAFALVEIPLVAYLLAPNATRAAMTALRDWIRARRRIEVVTLLAVVGCVLLAVGVTSL
jgi:Sap-like sulfolipid-1-addressing protein